MLGHVCNCTLARARRYFTRTEFTPTPALMQLASEQFSTKGYAVLPNFLDDGELKFLRQVQIKKAPAESLFSVSACKQSCLL